VQNHIHRISVFLLLIAAGCASNHPVVGAWGRPGLAPQRTDKIALTARPNPNDADAQLGRMLVPELQAAGFVMVPVEEADYLLAYAVEDDATVERGHKTVLAPSKPAFNHPQTTQQIVDQNLARRQPENLRVPTTYVDERQGIRLYLYTNPKTHSGKFNLAWSGCIDAGEKVSAEREPLLIRTLLGYFGKAYNGTVDLNHPQPSK